MAIVFANLERQESERRQLIADIETAGGVVEFDESIVTLFQSSRVSKVTLPHAATRDLGAHRLKSLTNLSELALTGVEVSDENGLAMQCSYIRFTTITGEMLDGLGGGIARVHVQKR